MFNQVRLINVLLFLTVCSIWIICYLNNCFLIENAKFISKQMIQLNQNNVKNRFKQNDNLQPELDPEPIVIILPKELEPDPFTFIPGIPDTLEKE